MKGAAAALMLAMVAGCSKPANKEGAAKTPDNAPYYTSLPLNELMPHVMQYAGDGIWKRQGFRSDKSGVHSLFPKTDEEWEEAESAGRTLAEVTNTLLVPGRRVPEPAWDAAVIHVRNVALKAAAAAEKHDKDAFFAAGSELDQACDDCHVRYDPTFRNQPK
jgi:hypothetical protein